MKKVKILAVICTLIMATNVHAALQSRPGVGPKDRTNATAFFSLIRNMEAEGGILGLNATFAENAAGAYEETSPVNNVDTHMCKNTEWGAAAMLSASDYGAGNGKVTSSYDSSTKTYGVKESTTGNMSGVFGLITNAEYMAAGIVSKMGSYCKYIKNAPVRYVDNYAQGTSESDFSRYIPGDATYETKNIIVNAGGDFVVNEYPLFYRANYTVFRTGNWSGYGYNITASARACLWVGEGI